jgi:hypothetical protein
MKRLFLILCFASVVSLSPAAAKTMKIALLAAEDPKGDVAHSILTAATSAFYESKRFQVIERDQLSKIFQERDLTDFIEGSPGDLSNLRGVDMIGVITYSKERNASLQEGGKEKDYFFIDVRLTDVRSGQVVGSVSSRRPSMVYEPTSPHNAGRLLLENVREMFPPEGSVLSANTKEVVVSMGALEGLKEGDQLEVIVDGEVLFDAEGKAYPPMEEVVATLRVIQVAAQLSKCKVKGGQLAIQPGSRVRLKATDGSIMNHMQRALPFLRKHSKKD